MVVEGLGTMEIAATATAALVAAMTMTSLSSFYPTVMRLSLARFLPLLGMAPTQQMPMATGFQTRKREDLIQ
jgi:hypothetical protein